MVKFFDSSAVQRDRIYELRLMKEYLLKKEKTPERDAELSEIIEELFPAESWLSQELFGVAEVLEEFGHADSDGFHLKIYLAQFSDWKWTGCSRGVFGNQTIRNPWLEATKTRQDAAINVIRQAIEWAESLRGSNSKRAELLRGMLSAGKKFAQE